jgi:dTDP-4-dehydrorhamnose reductase
MIRLLLIGKNGQLGWELQRTLATLGDLTAIDYPEIDLEQVETIRDLFHRYDPQVVINAAAYTKVDLAEAESDKAWKINALAPGMLAEEACRYKAALVHYSTDYVFDGGKTDPYIETDIPNPLNHYGRSKLEGERLVQAGGGAFLILRTSWVYSLRKGGFVNKVLEWARQQEKLRIVDDQVASPTWARALAQATAQLLAQGIHDLPGYLAGKAGLYHLAGNGFTSRYEWANRILELDPRREEQTISTLLPAATADFPTDAQRPLFSALNCDLFTKTFGFQLPAWEEALGLAMTT